MIVKTLAPVLGSFFKTTYTDTPDLSINLADKTSVVDADTDSAEQFMRISILKYFEDHRGFYTHTFRIILHNLANADDEKHTNRGISQFELDNTVH